MHIEKTCGFVILCAGIVLFLVRRTVYTVTYPDFGIPCAVLISLVIVCAVDVSVLEFWHYLIYLSGRSTTFCTVTHSGFNVILRGAHLRCAASVIVCAGSGVFFLFFQFICFHTGCVCVWSTTGRTVTYPSSAPINMYTSPALRCSRKMSGVNFSILFLSYVCDTTAQLPIYK